MSDEASPRPWRVEKAADECRFWIVRNPDGVSIGMTWLEDDAALIVEAVNERDRLRDIVKRMADKLEVHRGIFTASNVWSETGCHETCSLIREARAAIGEDAR